MRTFVKFCGVTDAATLAEVPEGGAAGFVIGVPSSARNLTTDAAAALVEQLPKGAEAWAVVVDPAEALVHQLFDEVGVDRIQVGGAIPANLEFLEIHHLVPSLPIPLTGTTGAEPKVPPAEDYARLHLDVVGSPLDDGSARQGDWEMCHGLVQAQPGRKLVLAGGLTPENVGAALETVGPWGVDVAAGVESAPGKKDPAKLRAFVAAVEAFESSHP